MDQISMEKEFHGITHRSNRTRGRGKKTSMITAEKIQECIDKGMNQHQIAKHFNVSDATIYRLAKEFSIDDMIDMANGFRFITPEYLKWRREVLERDRYICQMCGKINNRLEAHHIIRWVDAPELRYNVDNGITLCHWCHRHKVTGHEYEYAQYFFDITQPQYRDHDMLHSIIDYPEENEVIAKSNKSNKEEHNMKEIDKKFVPLMEQVHNEMDQEYDSTTTIIDDMLPREGESIIESLIRSRYAISNQILKGITDKEGSITPESINETIGKKDWMIVPLVLPYRINLVLDEIRERTEWCDVDDDGHVLYYKLFGGGFGWQWNGVSDMQTLTHAIVVGNALMLSDPLIAKDDVHGKYIDRGYTILDGINYINESSSKVYRFDRHLAFVTGRQPVSRDGLNDTRLGLRIYKERIEAIEDDYKCDHKIFSYFNDIGIMQLENIIGINIDPVVPIIRYVLELWKDHDNNHIRPPYYIDEMADYMDYIRRSVYYLAWAWHREMKVLKDKTNI